jgi:Holliday junction resolvase-like predicted endonuclease
MSLKPISSKLWINTGKKGEDHACGHLKKKGWIILERNLWLGPSEIDIIARAPKSELVFIEVKTMIAGSENDLQPEDNLNATKLSKMRKAASLYANANPQLIHRTSGWRIDLLAILLGQNELTQSFKCVTVEHYENL